MHNKCSGNLYMFHVFEVEKNVHQNVSYCQLQVWVLKMLYQLDFRSPVQSDRC